MCDLLIRRRLHAVFDDPDDPDDLDDPVLDRASHCIRAPHCFRVGRNPACLPTFDVFFDLHRRYLSIVRQ
jgi:hypothetical protein